MDTRRKSMDKIESSISQLCNRIDSLETDVTILKTTTKSIEEAAVFRDKEHEEVKKAVKSLTKDVNVIKQQLSEVKGRRAGQSEEVRELKEQLLDVQSRSMRDNLIFTGIEEKPEEDCEEVLHEFIRTKLRCERGVKFERVQHFPNRTRPRPIVAKFTEFKDREIIRQSAYKHLKGTSCYINEQFPKEIEDRRKQLYPVRREAARSGDKVRLVVDKLYIGDKP
ncbi:uncharacterized protein LOC124271574 [Haliotis rubra]|uniref:uncharacterized protein LOC124271574 n=1 Tax=Haliotis rubra TaxID=36100 RepID=UPI001EE4F415|nr:uncharacterized protein LOC124271574 [Haliotis rubra]